MPDTAVGVRLQMEAGRRVLAHLSGTFWRRHEATLTSPRVWMLAKLPI